MRVKEEPSASKLHGLHAKTTLSNPVALLMDNSYPYLKGKGFFEFHYYLLLIQNLVLDIHLKQWFFMGK